MERLWKEQNSKRLKLLQGHDSMRNCLIIVLSYQLFSSALFAQQTGILFQWETSSGKMWKTFGDEAAQLKYEGEIKNGEPEGLGVSSFHGTTSVSYTHLTLPTNREV